MKKTIFIILMIIGVIVTLSVLLYPTLSDYINAQRQSRVVTDYVDEVNNLKDDERHALLDAAHEYNANLLKNPNRYLFTEEDTKAYEQMLDVGSGVMGILEIDKIGVKLSIYHGTSEGVLQVGLGHFQGSSLPVGGLGTHAIITGHRGLPSSKLLTNLDKVKEGDTFTIYVLGETLTYQVDDIKTVEPADVQSLNIERDQDYCTLVTCTPYGINTHRLLVRGHRIPNAPNADWHSLYAGVSLLDLILVILIFMTPVLPFVILYIILKCRKIHKKGGNVCR